MNRPEMFDLLSVVSLRLAEATERGCAALGLTPSEARAITCLGEHGPLRLGVVGGHIGASPRRMTQVAESLGAKRLASRVTDRADARATLLALTATGRRRAREIQELRLAWAEDLLGPLSEQQVADFEVLLRTVAGRLDR